MPVESRRTGQEHRVTRPWPATGDVVRFIRALAASSAARAWSMHSPGSRHPRALPPCPRPPSPPACPVRLDASADNLTLRWKARNPTNARGTTYIIRRQLVDEEERTRERIPGGVDARRDSRTSRIIATAPQSGELPADLRGEPLERLTDRPSVNAVSVIGRR